MTFSSKLVGGALALAVTVTGVLPSFAAPVIQKSSSAISSDVTDVQYRRDRAGRVEFRSGRAYYNGHRGYRERRPGYRQRDGFWFPAGAFIAGAIIGGALNDGPRAAPRRANRHVAWCYDRWQSYRAYDNTYQPERGPRRVCRSPFG